MHTILQLFEKQVLLYPANIALSYKNKELTYLELNEKANQVAHYLLSQKITPETIVGVSLLRSPEVIITILGILKAGCVYVPIDPEHPTTRINYILSNAEISLLITQEALTSHFPQINNDNIIYLDKKELTYCSKSNPALIHPITSDQLAYILYTSGSTGTPKGVMVSHANLYNAFRGWETVYQLTHTDRHLQMASFSFDVSIGDMVRALCSGGNLILCSKKTLSNPEKLYQLLSSTRTNVAEFVPTIIRELITYCNEKHKLLDFMRIIISGSDNLSPCEFQALQRLAGGHVRIVNTYGLTETTIDSCYFENKEQKDNTMPHSIPLGKPFPNVTLLLLNENLNEVSVGEKGEIYIGGLGVAKGYVKLPKLTTDCFISYLDKRFYKTGDAGRLLTDGNIEFLGRLDNQIKLNGQRIELSEIENILNSCPFIKESIVLTHKNTNSRLHLIAYFVGKEENVTSEQINTFLAKHLPNYMIPHHFVRLESIPRTSNGKLDRKQLQTHPMRIPDHENKAPANPFQAEMLTIWKRAFNNQAISLSDDFYILGGDSLTLTKILGDIKKTFLVSLNVKELPYPLTIIKLTAQIEKNLQNNKNGVLTHTGKLC